MSDVTEDSRVLGRPSARHSRVTNAALQAELNELREKIAALEAGKPSSPVANVPVLPSDCKRGFGVNTVFDARNIRVGSIVDGVYVPDPVPHVPTPQERQAEALAIQKALEAKYNTSEPWLDPMGILRQGKDGQRVSIIEDEKRIRKQVEAEMAVEHRKFLGRDAD